MITITLSGGNSGGISIEIENSIKIGHEFFHNHSKYRYIGDGIAIFIG